VQINLLLFAKRISGGISLIVRGEKFNYVVGLY